MLSKSIPIYDGAPDICDYINEEAFIKYDETFIKKVMFLLSSRGMYNRMIEQQKKLCKYNIYMVPYGSQHSENLLSAA